MSIHKPSFDTLKTQSSCFSSDSPLTWYPIALSKDLKPLKHMSFTMFEEDWIAFRTKSKSLGVTSRFCCHIGTDLTNGKVVNECIECPMHGWQFNTKGVCEHIPIQKVPPKQARLKNLIVEEHFGIIFVFYGEKALFNFQDMLGSTQDLQYSTPKVVPLKSPANIIALNTFDTQHYKKVHAREFVTAPEISNPSTYCLKITYTARIIKKRWVDYIIDKLTSSETTVSIEAWGGILLLLRNKNTLFSSLVSIKPINETKSIIYITAIKDGNGKGSFFHSILDKIMLKIAVSLLKSYLEPDVNIIANIRPVKGVLLKDHDIAINTFFNYWESLPKFIPFHSHKRSNNEDS